MFRNSILGLKYLGLWLPLASSVFHEYQLPPDATPRPVPQEILYIYNVTKSNAGYCVYQYGDCLSPHTKNPICAMDREGNTKYFVNYCEMGHENCRWQKVIWTYFNDDAEEACLRRNVAKDDGPADKPTTKIIRDDFFMRTRRRRRTTTPNW